MTDIHLQPKQTIDGAVLESREPLSGEPSGRSRRDGLSAAPSPVAGSDTASRWTISVEDAGKLFLVLMLGIMFSVFGFLAWAIYTHGR